VVLTAPAIAAPLAHGDVLACDLTVIEHLSRNVVMDVYELWDERRYCTCIAKLLRPDLVDSQRDVARLRREGELLTGLSHPHIVRGYELREQPTMMVLLEALSGETLSHLIARRSRRMPVAELAILGLQATSAIRYLHAEGWLHLDLKPSNVIIDAGFTKLIDLSLAREPGYNGPGVGTRPYLAPEQARGGELTAAADIWGLGSLLYETATGQTPFESSGQERYPQLERRAPSVQSRRRLPAELASLIDACLEPDPARRPVADEVLATLEVFA
jgi:eukaryotic-like serine/threonine-protein kinase